VNNLSNIIVLLAAWLLPMLVSAQQTLDSDTTWADAVVVSEKITIAARRTLTIAPGAKVLFRGSGSLHCQGKLIAEDAFFVSGEDREPGIAIQGKGEMHFNYCQFQDFIQGGSRYNLFLQISNGNLFLRGCRFRRCAAVEYLYAGGGIDDCLFQDSQGIAVHLYHANTVQIRGTTFWGGTASSHLLQLFAAQRCQVRDCFFYGGESALRLGYGAKRNIFSYLNLHDQSIGVYIHGNENNDNLMQNLLVTDSRSVAVRLDSTGGASNLFMDCIFFRSRAGAINATAAPGNAFRKSVFLQHKNLLLGNEFEKLSFQENIFWETKLPKDLESQLLSADSNNRQAKPLLLDPDNMLFSPADPQDSPTAK